MISRHLDSAGMTLPLVVGGMATSVVDTTAAAEVVEMEVREDSINLYDVIKYCYI